MGRAARLLVVDDDESNRDMLARRLRRSGYEVEMAESGESALERLEANSFDLILLDMMMPEMSGLEVLQRVRQQHAPTQLPIIMVTALQESAYLAKALRMGANDYVTKPVDFTLASARIEAQLARRSDFAAQRTMDPLTDLPNRTWLEEELRRRSRAEEGCQLLVLEPDCLGRTEESLAYETGRSLLEAIAGRLRTLAETLPGRAVRCGSHRFALLLGEGASGAGIADQVRGIFREPFVVDGEALFITPTIGIAIFRGGECCEGALRDAYSALRHASEQGPGACQIFTPNLREHDLESLRLENDLRQGIARGELVVFYQPKVLLQSGAIDGAEALVRWNRPGHGLVMPSAFVELAERDGLIVPIGNQVLRRACQDMAALRRSYPELTVSVNVSGRQFEEPDLTEQILCALAGSGLPASALRLEITETSVMAHPADSLRVLERLHQSGVGLKLDDFGAGYSSLTYLRQFPFDALKIDRSFVAPLAPGSESLAIVETILALARTLKMSVVAEGIETRQQLDLLRQLGCDYGQGYWFSRPVDLEDFRNLLERWDPRRALEQESGVEAEELCPSWS